MIKQLYLLVFILACSHLLHAQSVKYGALAIDRENGFYYGWAQDYNTLEEAEERALQECTNKGGNATIVLKWSGNACAAYRTIDGKVGTAYGWGLADTKEAADVIATNECLKRSNGQAATNFVWACNGGNGPLKEITTANKPGTPAPGNNQANSASNDYITFNGSQMAASGECLEGGTGSLATDDEAYGVLFYNIPSGGTVNIGADMFTAQCNTCPALMLTDISNTKSFVATKGSLTRNGKMVSFTVTVMELTELLSGSGSSSNLSGSFNCED